METHKQIVYTLINTNDKLILCSDEKIEKGDYYTPNDFWYKDYLQATKEDLEVLQEKRNGYLKLLSQSPKLSKEVADEIGWIDVKELFKPESDDYEGYINGCINGFKKAQELNQKKYTEEDLKKLCELSFHVSNFSDDFLCRSDGLIAFLFSCELRNAFD